MKIFVLIFLLFTSLLANNIILTEDEKAWIKANPQVPFSGDPHWLPFEAIDENGNYIGIVADYLKIVSQKTGLSFVLKPVESWSDTLELSLNTEVDIISGDIADETINKNYRPINPYLINPIIILMQHDANYVEKLESLENKKIAIIKGYGYTADLYKNYPKLKFIEVENAKEGLIGVSTKKFDAMLASESLASYTIASMNLKNVKIVGKTSVLMEVTLFVDKQKPMLHTILSKAVNSISVVKQQEIINFWRAKKGQDYISHDIIWIALFILLIVLATLAYLMGKLKKSKDYYKKALGGSPDSLWSWDVISGEIFFSLGSSEILGLVDKEVPTSIDTWNERIHPEDRELLEKKIEQIFEERNPKLSADFRMLHHDGHWIWIHLGSKVSYDTQGKALRLSGFCHDVSHEKLKQLANEANTKRLESAQEIGHLGSWEWNIATGDLAWSDEVYRIFGEKPQSFPATYEAFLSYIPQEYQQGLADAIEDAMTSKKPYEYDHEILRKDGSRRLVREAGYVLFDEKGEAQFMLGTVLDINTVVEVSSTKKENRELNDLLEKFDANVIASNTDLDGIITYASKAFSDISGYSIEELMGQPQNIIRHEDTPSAVFKDLWDTLHAGKSWKGELKNKRKDGSFYWVFNTIDPIKDDAGNTIGYSAIRQDLTHEKEAESLHQSLELKTNELLTLNQELEYRVDLAVLSSKDKDHLLAQQSKLASMGEMIGNIAHQWRQPLNALGLLIQKQQVLYERDLLTAEKMQEGVDKGTALISKMSTTIDDFRDFFKPNKEKVPFHVQSAIEDTLALIDAALYNQNISLDLQVEDNQMIYGYKSEFSQVILNLINNAKDVLFELKVPNPKIIVKTQTRKEFVMVNVSDNGGGIQKDIMEHVFEPYFTTKDEGKGTGIGLYMSKMIIEENMNGYLSVVNNDLGAEFTILVPAAIPEEIEQKV